ncbi:MAG: phosphoribosylamine--glycine ligase [Armatimonadota bacterium]
MAQTLRLFVIGGGGREHAMAWHLSRAFPEASLYAAPGNPGISRLAVCLPISADDCNGLADAAATRGVHWTLVGPEVPLVAGIVDAFEARGLPIIGPTAAAARIEGSKTFAKDLMQKHGVPTAEARAFDDPASALAYVRGQTAGVVVKADGLAAGKGVVVCDDAEQACAAIETIMVRRAFGNSGQRIVIEERLEGEEVSAFALVDGEAVALLPAAQDHKRVFDGDRGPNTGGMGAVAPYPLTDALRDYIRVEIFERVAHALCAEGHPYRGILFAGLMLTRDGPRVLEFNCRLGDPEAQVVLPLLSGNLVDACADLHAGRLAPDALVQTGGAAVGVVLASRGYPQAPEAGDDIDGLESAAEDALIFHAGTTERDGRIVTAGGRVITVVGLGTDVAAARVRAYRAAKRILFAGMHYRWDIGAAVASAPRADETLAAHARVGE